MPKSIDDPSYYTATATPSPCHPALAGDVDLVAQLDERLEHTNPATTRCLARSRTGDGGVIEVLEPFRAQERYREWWEREGRTRFQ